MSDWQQHTCVHCGTKFRYIAGGRKKLAPEIEAYLGIVKRFFVPSPEMEIQGCPQCGLVPAESIGAKRLATHNTCLRLGLVFLLPLLVVGLSRPFPILLVVSGVLLLLWLSHLAVLLENPNKDLDANRKQAGEKMEEGMLRVDCAGEQNASAAPRMRGWNPSYLLPIILGLLAAGLAGSAEIALQVNHWPRNSNWEPDVAGPGDRVRTYFPNKLKSINGLWTGTASAEILNAEELGLKQGQLAAFTRQTTWGQTIQTERKHAEKFSELWAEVVLPQEPGLAWQTLHIRFTVEVEYPALFYFLYEDAGDTIRHTESLQTASPLAGLWYAVLALGGMWIGTGLFVLQSFWLIKLARKLMEKGNSTATVASN